MSKSKKSKIKGNKLSSRQLQREILQLFQRDPKKRFNPRQVSKKLKVDNNSDSIADAMEQLAEAGKLIPLGDFKFKINRTELPPEARGEDDSKGAYEGFVDMTRSGDAYIVCEGLTGDVHVSAKYMNTALHGDRVRIRVWMPRGRRRPEGEVIKILERASEHFLGTLYLYPAYALVAPEGNLPHDIVVPLDQISQATDGDKVVVEITEWSSGRYKNPVGRVTTVLGKAGSHDIEMKAILINNGFDLEFTREAMREAESLPAEIGEEELVRRRDMRGVTTFTIDPFNARDFDDALSFRLMEDGHYEIGVHIADVSHYVKPRTPLDREAFQRSTSVYLVDRVLPMLPERLSNELCSLRPHEDKLTFSAIFHFSPEGKVTNRWFGRTIIHSDRRFTYEEAQQVLETGEGDFAEELRKLNEFAHILRKERFRNGAINFETEEVSFRLDENGSPVEVFAKERKDAHMLIEDFMLLANREVATFIATKGQANGGEIPFVYRVHDQPDPDKVAELARFAHEMGFEMRVDTPKNISRSYNQLVTAARLDPSLKLLEPIAIRTMAKAIYSTDNIGHYGLAFDNYTHFTSPIRRYSDVLAHRILDLNLDPEQVVRLKKDKLEEECKHISLQERKAMEAERESIKYKQVEFMEKHLGDVFTGYISGILDRGIFVELEGNRCEGLVDFTTMPEYYEVLSGKLRVQGRSTGKIYKMGDRIRVRIIRTDLQRRQIEMAWVGEALPLESAAEVSGELLVNDDLPDWEVLPRRRRKKAEEENAQSREVQNPVRGLEEKPRKGRRTSAAKSEKTPPASEKPPRRRAGRSSAPGQETGNRTKGSSNKGRRKGPKRREED